MYQYSLSSPYDVSTGSYDNVSFDYSSQADDANAVTFKPDGSKMYICNFSTNDVVYQYSTVSSLTAGQQYYVQTDGTISTTAGSPSVLAGTAISATELLVKT